MSDFLQRFASEFTRIDKNHLHLLAELYSDDVHFTDPLHEVQGLAQLQQYFGELYANVSELHFDVTTEDGRPVNNDIHRVADGERDSVLDEMRQLAKAE